MTLRFDLVVADSGKRRLSCRGFPTMRISALQENSTSRLRRALRTGISAAFIAAALSAVVWFFHWTVKTSGGFFPPGEEDYYNFLVRGWRGGHLSLSKEPSAAMRALADPYDPAQNAAVRMGDASYYQGKYYLYFGATPAAVLLAPYYFLTGKELGSTTAIFVFCTIGFLAASGVWLSLRRRYFPESATWLAVAGVLVLGVGTHLLALQRRPLVWELPIATGFAFTMLALAAVHWALHGRRPVLAMGIAGLCLGLAVGARPTTLLGIGMLVPPLWCLWRRDETGGLWKRAALAGGATLTLCLAVVLAHNAARFGNPLEFGQNYQLSGVYESRVRHFHWSYMAHNFSIYFMHAPDWSGSFPFLRTWPVVKGPPGYLGSWNEEVAGLLVTLPAMWFVAALPLAWRRRNGGTSDNETTEWATPVDDAGLRAMIAAIALYGGAMMLVILGYFLATTRYAADFTPALGLLAVIGVLGAERAVGGWRTRIGRVGVRLLIGAVLATTVALGVLLSFDYHARRARETTPWEWGRLEKFFSRAK
jgi:hypothetical protein